MAKRGVTYTKVTFSVIAVGVLSSLQNFLFKDVSSSCAYFFYSTVNGQIVIMVERISESTETNVA